LTLLMWSSGASGLGMPGAGNTWNVSLARRANAVIAAPPSQHNSAGREMDAAQGLGDAGRVETRQHGIDGRTAAVAGNHDRDLLHRQPPLGGLATPLARGPRKVSAFAFEQFKNEPCLSG
jgi:hypothetical protein